MELALVIVVSWLSFGVMATMGWLMTEGYHPNDRWWHFTLLVPLGPVLMLIWIMVSSGLWTPPSRYDDADNEI